MALSFDMLTALTISGIVAILAIYVIVVYKKGWLKGESKVEEAYYLCPSQKCRKVFNKPVWLTDLSKTPPESYQACPHCGAGIQRSTELKTHERLPSKVASRPVSISPESQRRHDTSPITGSDTTSARAESSSEQAKPSLHHSTTLDSAKPEGRQMSKPHFQFPRIRKNTSDKSGEKVSSESHRTCSHFFGYVKTLPKNTPIPDECLWCPSIVDCLSHEQKVKAEA